MPRLESCSSCGAARNQGDRCGYCGALYPDMIHSPVEETKTRSLDGKYRVSRFGDWIKITWRWRNASTWFLIPFFLFWNAMAFSLANISQIMNNPLSLFPIPGLHMLIGIGGAGYVIVTLLNSTTIDVGGRYLTIRHHPLPWPGHKFAVKDIDTLYVSKGQRSSKERSWDVPILQMVTKDGIRTQLLKGATETDFADYESLRHKLMETLKIDPKPVYGAA